MMHRCQKRWLVYTLKGSATMNFDLNELDKLTARPVRPSAFRPTARGRSNKPAGTAAAPTAAEVLATAATAGPHQADAAPAPAATILTPQLAAASTSAAAAGLQGGSQSAAGDIQQPSTPAAVLNESAVLAPVPEAVAAAGTTQRQAMASARPAFAATGDAAAPADLSEVLGPSNQQQTGNVAMPSKPVLSAAATADGSAAAGGALDVVGLAAAPRKSRFAPAAARRGAPAASTAAARGSAAAAVAAPPAVAPEVSDRRRDQQQQLPPIDEQLPADQAGTDASVAAATTAIAAGNQLPATQPPATPSEAAWEPAAAAGSQPCISSQLDASKFAVVLRSSLQPQEQEQQRQQLKHPPAVSIAAGAGAHAKPPQNRRKTAPAAQQAAADRAAASTASPRKHGRFCKQVAAGAADKQAAAAAAEDSDTAAAFVGQKRQRPTRTAAVRARKIAGAVARAGSRADDSSDDKGESEEPDLQCNSADDDTRAADNDADDANAAEKAAVDKARQFLQQRARKAPSKGADAHSADADSAAAAGAAHGGAQQQQRLQGKAAARPARGAARAADAAAATAAAAAGDGASQDTDATEGLSSHAIVPVVDNSPSAVARRQIAGLWRRGRGNKLDVIDITQKIDLDHWSLRNVARRASTWEKQQLDIKKKAQQEAAAAAAGAGDTDDVAAGGSIGAGPSDINARGANEAAWPLQYRNTSGASLAAAPQLRIAEDGSVILDETSLTIQAQPQEVALFTRADEQPRFLNSMTYLNTRNTDRWTATDTDLFYKALKMFGTDFTAIAKLFPGRDRRHMKFKFNKESKLHWDKIQEAMSGGGLDEQDMADLTAMIQASLDAEAGDEEATEVLNQRQQVQLRQQQQQGEDPEGEGDEAAAAGNDQQQQVDEEQGCLGPSAAAAVQSKNGAAGQQDGSQQKQQHQDEQQRQEEGVPLRSSRRLKGLIPPSKGRTGPARTAASVRARS
eukprot:GHRR01006916.1.p1 GENE.GHRR01006916.1~~GHRR01006916.1.p1  ORF type:complete len:966 (+),score=514.46 GHRR01006916.1:410-3307(+)